MMKKWIEEYVSMAQRVLGSEYDSSYVKWPDIVRHNFEPTAYILLRNSVQRSRYAKVKKNELLAKLEQVASKGASGRDLSKASLVYRGWTITTAENEKHKPKNSALY